MSSVEDSDDKPGSTGEDTPSCGDNKAGEGKLDTENPPSPKLTTNKGDAENVAKTSEIPQLLTDDKSKSSASSQDDDLDEDMVLKWDEDDDDKLETDQKEIDENELLNETEDNGADKTKVDVGKCVEAPPGQSLKDPNAMLHIPLEILNCGDSEGMMENWGLIPDDEEDEEMDTNTNIDNETKADNADTDIKDLSEKLNENKTDTSNVGDKLIQSLAQDVEQIDKEPLNMVPFTIDSDPESDEPEIISGAIQTSKTEDCEPKMTEEEEIRNAISGLEASMQETGGINSIVEEINDSEGVCPTSEESQTDATKSESIEEKLIDRIADVTIDNELMSDQDVEMTDFQETVINVKEDMLLEIKDTQLDTDSVEVTKDIQSNTELVSDDLDKENVVCESKPDNNLIKIDTTDKISADLEMSNQSDITDNDKCIDNIDLIGHSEPSNSQNTELITSKSNIIPNVDEECSITNDEEISKAIPKSDDVKECEKAVEIEAKPSTSKDDSEDGMTNQDATDSLGLLAESSRVMEYEDYPEDDEDGDDDEDSDTNEVATLQPEDTEMGSKIGELNEIEKLQHQEEELKEIEKGEEGSEEVSNNDCAESKTTNEMSTTTNGLLNFVDLEESSSEDDIQMLTKAKESEVCVPLEMDSNSNTDAAMPEVNSDTQNQLPTQTTKPENLEVFNIDSDDEEAAMDQGDTSEASELKTRKRKCVNEMCPNTSSVYEVADNTTVSFYDGKKCRHYVCETCSDVVVKRNMKLIEGIRGFEELLKMDLGKDCKEPIEVLDSDSDEEVEVEDQVIGEDGARFIEEELAEMLNATWDKFKMDERLFQSVELLKDEMADLEKESEQVSAMLQECQQSTDQLRNELYATFQPEIRDLASLIIVDTPTKAFTALESSTVPENKRRLSQTEDVAAKKAIPLGYAPLKQDRADSSDTDKIDDDNTDISVVKLSAEAAPADLPPPGDIVRPQLRRGMAVYAMRSTYGTWGRATVLDVATTTGGGYTSCRVRFESAARNSQRTLTARWLACRDPPNARMTIGTRVIALFQDTADTTVQSNRRKQAFYSGIIAEVPNPVNNYRYLIFFDDGYAQYAKHPATRLVYESSSPVWEEVHPMSREFVKQYLLAYPERPMVRLHPGQSIRIELNGKWWQTKVVQVDASLVLVAFGPEAGGGGAGGAGRREWVYRGSTRLAPLFLELQAAERPRARALPRAQVNPRTNIPYVEYTRSDEQTNKINNEIAQRENEEIRRQRSVAKKSTAQTTQIPQASTKLENFSSRVVYYSPKNAVRPHKLKAGHACGPHCRRSDVLQLKDLRTYNPLAKPLLSGWERQLVRHKGGRCVLYRAPCGRRVRDARELHRYLRLTRSPLPVDLFDFQPHTHCLAEFHINKTLISKKDLSNGKENMPVPCVNYYDESLPEFCSYNTERTPTAGVPLNLDPEFLCGCDCDDDCEDKTKCACWKLTLEGARTIGLDADSVGYVYRRLPDPLPSGIYECNSRCKCKSTCLNRVAQHPLQLKLQVFKTTNRGWGIRALNDVPKGSFLCIYAGNLLTDATANLDGLNEGDEYLAELDYIEVVEQMKEGYEEDIPESIKQLDKKESENTEESEPEESSEEDSNTKSEKDDEFDPGYITPAVTTFNKRLRKRNKKKDKKEEEKQSEPEKEKEREGDGEKTGDDCITISDDEEVREPSRFTVADGMEGNEFVSKYKSVRTLFGEDEACYIMDAKVQGNIGRYLNHSCCPNVFVQNVFVDTHDPRFPWVAFFALTHIRAGKELTWNYNYDVGSVPGKVMYCRCGEPSCRGRLL